MISIPVGGDVGNDDNNSVVDEAGHGDVDVMTMIVIIIIIIVIMVMIMIW